jgi:transposase
VIYRERNIVERTIGWLKEYRRIATRHEKLGIMYLGMVTIAFISEYLNHYLSVTA